MDRVSHHLAVVLAQYTDDDATMQRAQLALIARYLRALGGGLELSQPGSAQTATLIEAARILERHQAVLDPAVTRSVAVSDARRCMAVADAQYAPRASEFTPVYWRLLNVLAVEACGAVRTEASRRVLLSVARLAERKASARPKNRRALAVVPDPIKAQRPKRTGKRPSEAPDHE